MATSLRDVLGVLEAEIRACVEAPDLIRANDAAISLGAAARALDRVACDGLDQAVGGLRELAVRELASACRAAAAAWDGLPGGRLTDLMSVAADIAGLNRSRLGRDGRWATAIAFAHAARRAAGLAQRFEPYATVRQLARVRNAHVTVARLGAFEPPDVLGWATLERAVPLAVFPADLRASVQAEEVVTALVSELERLEVRACPLRLFEALAVLRVGEEAAERATQVALAAGTLRDAEPWVQTPAAWRAARHALRPFDDGTRTLPERTAVLLLAVRLHQGLDEEFRTCRGPDDLQRREDLAQLATAVRRVANELPRITSCLEDTACSWVRDGLLTARSNALPIRESRVRAHLVGDPVRADGRDLRMAVAAIYTAGLLSSALAAHLHASAPAIGAQPQPLLAAVHVSRVASPAASEELARRARLLAQRSSDTPSPPPRISVPRSSRLTPR